MRMVFSWRLQEALYFFLYIAFLKKKTKTKKQNTKLKQTVKGTRQSSGDHIQACSFIKRRMEGTRGCGSRMLNRYAGAVHLCDGVLPETAGRMKGTAFYPPAPKHPGHP